VAELRLLVPARGRDRERLVRDLRTVLDEGERSGTLPDVRIDTWWDPASPEVWARTTTGPRIRWTVSVTDDGYEILVRGPFEVRLRKPKALRELMRALR
jgi:hypothetical protein